MWKLYKKPRLQIPTIEDYINKTPHPNRIEGGLRTRGRHKKCSKPNQPLVSVITIVRDGEKHLEQAIQSVLSQTYDNIEYIIIDGASTDGTLDIIRKYDDQIDYWMSEPDEGLYDAINKGIALSKGTIIKVLNADDWLPRGSASIAVKNSLGKPSEFILLGKMTAIDEKVGVRITCRPELQKRLFPIFLHPTWYVSRGCYESLGLYMAQYLISADYEFFRRAKSKLVCFLKVDADLACFRMGGASWGFRGALDGYDIDRMYLGALTALYRFVRHSLMKGPPAMLMILIGRKAAWNIRCALRRAIQAIYRAKHAGGSID